MKTAVLGGGIALALLAVLAASAAALDLDAVLREVATANPTLAARREMVEAARRRVGPAGAWQSPMLELGPINVPTSGRFDQDPMTMKMIELSQRVPVFGGNRLSRKSAEAEVGAEGAATETAHYELFAMAWEAYADAYYARQLVRSALGHQAEMDRLVRSAQARYESGNGRLEDVLRAQAERARTLTDLAAFQSESRGVEARLNTLMGREPGPLGDTLSAPPPVAIPDQADPWLAGITPSHPRLRELQARLERHQLAANAARRMAWPDLELTGSYGIREPIAGVSQDNMWSATVGFMVPIFAGQREFSEGAEMDAMARADEAELHAARLDLEQQVVATHAAAQSNRRTVTLLADTVVVTQRLAVEASWSAYTAGSSDLWRVFEGTHSLYGEEIALIRARQELARTESRILSLTARADLVGLTLPAIQESKP
jgi:outer membrane protein TolC